MADLKQDLTNKLSNERYYDEIELARLASDPNIYYKEKVEKMSEILKRIANVNDALNLMDQYFSTAKPQQTNPKPQQTQTVHAGQTHGE